MKKLMFAAFALALAAQSHAGVIWFSPVVPTDPAPSTMGPYAISGVGDDTRPVPNMVSSVGGLTFSEDVLHAEIGTGWATWSHGYTGDVYATYLSDDKDDLTMTLPSGVSAFYFYAEPNVFSTFSLTAFLDGSSTSISQLVQGFAGAKFFGVYDDAGGFIDKVVIHSGDASGFAVGEFGGNVDVTPASAPVPEPGTLLLLGGGLVGLYRKTRAAKLAA